MNLLRSALRPYIGTQSPPTWVSCHLNNWTQQRMALNWTQLEGRRKTKEYDPQTELVRSSLAVVEEPSGDNEGLGRPYLIEDNPTCQDCLIAEKTTLLGHMRKLGTPQEKHCRLQNTRHKRLSFDQVSQLSTVSLLLD